MDNDRPDTDCRHKNNIGQHLLAKLSIIKHTAAKFDNNALAPKKTDILHRLDKSISFFYRFFHNRIYPKTRMYLTVSTVQYLAPKHNKANGRNRTDNRWFTKPVLYR